MFIFVVLNIAMFVVQENWFQNILADRNIVSVNNNHWTPPPPTFSIALTNLREVRNLLF